MRGTAEDQAIQMSSTVICNMVIFYKFIVCRQWKFYFLMANLCHSFFHYFFFSFRIIQRVFMLSNKSFIVYCTVLITITNVQDIKEPWILWCNFFMWSFVKWKWNCPYFSLFSTESTNKMQQLFKLSFKYSSTYFGHPHAHHQELQLQQQQPLVYRRSLVIAMLLVVVWLARPRPTALLSPSCDGKPEAAAAAVVAPDDGHEGAWNMLSCI